MNERYRYWKQGVKTDRWKLIPDTDEAFNDAIKKGAKYTTVASFTLNENKTPDRYFSPLYFDFDSEDVKNAIEDSKDLVLMLESEYDFPIDALRIYLTGGRGCHIEIPAKTFGAEDGGLNLPHIYKRMVEKWNFDTLDYVVYCQGKGRMWRIPNLRRSNGRYKIPITAKELLHSDYEELVKLTHNQRPDFEFNSPSEYPVCDALKKEFEQTKKEFYENKKLENKTPIKSDKIKECFNENVPSCITSFLNIKGLTTGGSVNFNIIALTLARYYVNAGLSQNNLIEDTENFCNSNFSDSKSYHNFDKKQQHLRNEFNFVLNNLEDYPFSCGYPKSLIKQGVTKNVDCGNCPLGNDVKPLPVSTLSEIKANPLPLPSMIIERGLLVAGGILMISAPPKVGKSQIALNIALLLSSGQNWFNFRIPKPVITLIIQAEVSDPFFQDRVLTMFKNADTPLNSQNLKIAPRTQFDILNKDGFNVLKKTLQIHKPAVCIVDPLVNFHSVDDENNNSRMADVISNFRELTNLTSFIIIHHSRKAKSSSPIANLRGASAIGGAVDSIIEITKEDDGKRKCTFDLRYDKIPNPIYLHLNPHTLWFEKTVGNLTKRQKKAISKLDIDVEYTKKDLVSLFQKAGVHGSTAYGYVNVFISHQYLHEKGGLFTLKKGEF